MCVMVRKPIISRGGKEAGVLDVYIEHDISEHIPTEKEEDEFNEEDSENEVEKPKEAEEPEEFEDEIHEEEKEAENQIENVTGEGVAVGESDDTGAVNEDVEGENADEGDEVVLDAGNGGNDDRFKSLFDEGTKTIPEKEVYINREEQTMQQEKQKKVK
uniref:Uncharacterized protein n=1 Tax=Noccaea caerulescens TaxID=107243 RepID=A0A1J3J840_NOCCA